MTASELLDACRTFEREHGSIILCEVLEALLETAESFEPADDDEPREYHFAFVVVH